jgi:hypothetical protein
VEFRAAAGRKVRTPTDEVAATLRALGARFVGAPDGRSSAALLGWMVNTLGGNVLGWRRPDGEPLESDAWTSVSRVLGSFRMHWDLPAGKWTGTGVLPRAHTWIPRDGVRFDHLVDHVSRRVLGRPATPRLVRACCQAARMRPSDRVRWSRSEAAARVPLILGTVLDTPVHLVR